MKKQISNKHKKTEQFKIRNKKWTFWVCLLATIGFLIGFFVLFDFKNQNKATAENFYNGYLFLVLSLVCAVGVYIHIHERFIYSNGVYKYYGPFRKKQFAEIEEISFVKISTYTSYARYGLRVLANISFYDKNENILISIEDDGALRKNEIFLKSLKQNHIEILYEHKR